MEVSLGRVWLISLMLLSPLPSTSGAGRRGERGGRGEEGEEGGGGEAGMVENGPPFPASDTLQVISF